MSSNLSVNNSNTIAADKLSFYELFKRSLFEGVEGDEAQKLFHERIQSCSKRQLEDLTEELIGAKDRDRGIQYSQGCIDSLVCGLLWEGSHMAGKLP